MPASARFLSRTLHVKRSVAGEVGVCTSCGLYTTEWEHLTKESVDSRAPHHAAF